MNSAKGTSPGRGRLTAVPLAVAYLAVPLGTAAARYVGGGELVSPTLPWLLLAGLGALIAMYRPLPGSPAKRGFFFKGTLFLLLVAGTVMYAADVLAFVMPYLSYFKEMSPLVFLLFCGLWVGTCGMPDRADFQRYGGALGLLCVVDTLAEGVLYQAIPTIRWIGNADVLAGLLLVALCASLKPGCNDGGCSEPDQGHTWWRACVMAGVIACLSRTGLFAAAWVVLCFGRGGFWGRAGYAALCALLIGATFFLPATPSDAVRYTDYWLWVEIMRLASENPGVIFAGFPIDQALPITFPPSMGSIWEAATGQPSLFGVYLTQVPSFWLRLVFAWGIGVPLLVLTLAFIVIFRRLTRMGAGLTAALFAQGMTTPLVFEPAMAVVIFLGFILATSAPASRNLRSEKTAPESTDSFDNTTTDPTEEWDLRPL